MLEHDKTCIEVFRAHPIQPDNRHPRNIITQFSSFCKGISDKSIGFFEYANFTSKSYRFSDKMSRAETLFEVFGADFLFGKQKFQNALKLCSAFCF